MFTPIPLNLPAYAAKIRRDGTRLFIFDELRKKQLVLTPEEWVRQHWIQHLIHTKKYPKALIKIEGGLKLNEMPRRSDLVIYDTLGNKILLAEFKAPSVKITQRVFEQIAHYNTIHRIPLLLVSNGLQHFYCRIDFEQGDINFLDDLPDYLP
ncbi:type I restriction enzyme HsdR N-terminal domain-containing protein [Parapedobacter sp. ISTM3]|uniref:Type I restriction enzyme R protein N terminus (HSDR_N) n=1 Tax=Parapedobacter luteus TaxID=623280 RepID=A0A1T5CG81_9SPHI|nr:MULTISPECIES: type I restriction enzyme HsdR N-terminal domain-containing protein [Parapedobacter]MBK1438925.1 type I restriction enzyme HsdR N-terminal domain-containing protein [Parapedobacter sp. ISTM3]SKB58495.1 Type I restriction enzyme R protein N terminus (HSDR_N) [Parapedobacter luteus]